jgi:dsDNA-specific endonuclease/ATPase MutS2
VTPDAVDALSGKERRTAERKDQKASQALHEAPERPPARVRETDQQRRDDPELRNAALRMDFNTVDLRGMRVDEATTATEAFFDARSLAGIRTLFVLHGHGTGALKTAMRAWLPQSRYVRTSRPADADEGGDAYTVVELR